MAMQNEMNHHKCDRHDLRPAAGKEDEAVRQKHKAAFLSHFLVEDVRIGEERPLKELRRRRRATRAKDSTAATSSSPFGRCLDAERVIRMSKKSFKTIWREIIVWTV
jgi:hypothetical protein